MGGTTRTYNYKYGDQWNVDVAGTDDDLLVYVNTRPAKAGTFPTLADLDPYYEITDYFDSANG